MLVILLEVTLGAAGKQKDVTYIKMESVRNVCQNTTCGWVFASHSSKVVLESKAKIVSNVRIFTKSEKASA